MKDGHSGGRAIPDQGIVDFESDFGKILPPGVPVLQGVDQKLIDQEVVYQN